MHDLPHRYTVRAQALAHGILALNSNGLEPIENAAPAEFGGPGDLWSPETMLAGAVAGCFILTFRATARAPSLPWISIECPAEGVLERKDGLLQFTGFTLRPRVIVPAATDRAKVLRVLEKAERGCLVANSLRATMKMEPQIIEAEAERREASAPQKEAGDVD